MTPDAGGPQNPDLIVPAPDWAPETLIVQAGRPAKVPGAPMNPPMVLSSTYVLPADIAYGRDGNAGWAALESALGALEGGSAVTFSSGLAAATAIADMIPVRGTVVLSSATYFGVRMILERMQEQGRLTMRIADTADTEAFIRASDGADMVWVESISNPLITVADVPAIVAAAKRNGAISVVDSTFATPLRQRPLVMGADVVLHSATKAIGGHSDSLLGAAIAADPSRAQTLSEHRHDHGAVPGALEAFLALRGLRTLAVRLDRAEANAGELARRLEGHRSVSAVHHPALASHPQHELATRVLPDGSGNMLAFEVAGSIENTDAFLGRLRLLTNATSLGGVETKIERRSRWSSESPNVPPTLCRMSSGIEDVENLWADLDQALGARSITP